MYRSTRTRYGVCHVRHYECSGGEHPHILYLVVPGSTDTAALYDDELKSVSTEADAAVFDYLGVGQSGDATGWARTPLDTYLCQLEDVLCDLVDKHGYTVVAPVGIGMGGSLLIEYMHRQKSHWDKITRAYLYAPFCFHTPCYRCKPWSNAPVPADYHRLKEGEQANRLYARIRDELENTKKRQLATCIDWRLSISIDDDNRMWYEKWCDRHGVTMSYSMHTDTAQEIFMAFWDNVKSMPCSNAFGIDAELMHAL